MTQQPSHYDPANHHYHPQAAPKKKMSTGAKVALWIGGAVVALPVLGIIAIAVLVATLPSSGDTTSTSAIEEEDAAVIEEDEQGDADEEDEAAQDEDEEAAQEEEGAEEEEDASEPTDEPEPEPKTLDEKIDDLANLESLDHAEAFYDEDTGNIHVYDERDPGLSDNTMCNGARDATLKVLEYVQENIDEDYNDLMLSFTARGEEDATGDAPIVGMATVVYTAETVDEIDASPMNLSVIWETRDEGSIAQNCQ